MSRPAARGVAGALLVSLLLGVSPADRALSQQLEAPPLADAENFGGLPEGPGREVVFYNCAICHSTRIVLQQRLSRERWDETLDWMVEEQGMAAPAPETREIILDYLAKHLGPDAPR